MLVNIVVLLAWRSRRIRFYIVSTPCPFLAQGSLAEPRKARSGFE